MAAPDPVTRPTIQAFNKSEVRTLAVLAALVLPLGRARSEPGPSFDAVAFLDREVAVGADLCMFREGLRWFDEAAFGIFGREFAALHANEQVEVIHLCDGKASKELCARYDPRGLAPRFFSRFRYHAFRGFYASASGWAAVGYMGPPQGT